MVWKYAYFFRYNLRIIFVSFFFHKTNSVIFLAKVNRYLVSCVCISSYSIMLVPLKLSGYLGHGLYMCISFRCNHQLILATFFH